MRFDSRIFTLAKDPEQPSAYQDAYASDPERGIAAIADGVSSALFSGPWASILAEAVVTDCPDPNDPGGFAAWLERLRAVWTRSIDTSSLAWFQKAKLPSGAFSTLLWIWLTELDHAEAGAYGGCRLLGHAIGDSCLFHVRSGELVRTFPMQSAAEFDVDPIVLGSVDLKRDHLVQFAALDEVCYPGDQLILCTDALAEWAVRSYESGDPPVWDDFWKMSEDDWRAGIVWLRHERQMRTDDSTMLLLRVVDQRVENASVQDGSEPAEQSAGEVDESPLSWIDSASKDVKSVSSKMADQVDQASEKVLQGFKSLKDKALQKYREKFGKNPDRPDKK